MRFKYSENEELATELHFDVIEHGEYMGVEQNGIMKKVPSSLVKDRIIENVQEQLDSLTGTGWTDETVKGNADAVEPSKAPAGMVKQSRVMPMR